VVSDRLTNDAVIRSPRTRRAAGSAVACRDGRDLRFRAPRIGVFSQVWGEIGEMTWLELATLALVAGAAVELEEAT
jgi:hypothetical protein